MASSYAYKNEGKFFDLLSGTDSVSNTISEEEDVIVVSKEQTK